MEIENINTKDIKPYPGNTKAHPPDQVKKIVRSIQEYGFQVPVLVDKENVIIAGHGRLLAAEQIGLEAVPVVRMDHLTESQVRAFRLMDNKSNESDWLPEELALELKMLSSDGFDMDLTGFDDIEIKQYMEDIEGVQGLTDDDEVPEVEAPITKTGDLWVLGDHRVFCEDATKKENVERLMDGEKVDLVFADPPYGMSLDTDWSEAKSNLSFAKEKHVLGGKKYKQVIGDHDDFTPQIITTVLKHFQYCKEVFLWGADYFAEYLIDKNNGSWIVWDKRLDESMDKIYGSTFELCWSKTKHKRRIARVKWAGIFGIEKEFDHKRHHPTQKPAALAEWFFNEWGKGADLVVDPFLGSGSTLIACEKTNRKCYGMEIDPHYCDVIVTRWENYTGKKARRING